MAEQAHALQIKEAAHRLGVHPHTLDRAIKAGNGPPAVRIGNVIRLPRQEFEAWIKNGGTPAKRAGKRGRKGGWFRKQKRK